MGTKALKRLINHNINRAKTRIVPSCFWAKIYGAVLNSIALGARDSMLES